MIATERLLLRQWRDDDRAPFAALNADAAVMRFFERPLDRAESDAAADRSRDHIAEHGWGRWAVEAPGIASFIGAIGIVRPAFEAHFTPCVEVGWRLARPYWGFGYATEAAAAAIAFGFDTLGLKQIVSFTPTANRPSRAVMERLGMRHDPRDDFDYPRLAADHPLRPHVLYRLDRRL